MIVDTMTIDEVAYGVLSAYKENFERIGKVLGAKNKEYRRFILKNDGKHYFNPFTIKIDNVTTFYIYPYYISKSDYKKNGWLYSVVCKVYYRKRYIWCYLPNYFNNCIFFTQHFFERYNERHLGSEFETVNDELVRRFFVEINWKSIIDFGYRGNNDEVSMNTNIGQCCGERISDRCLLMKTFINDDTIKIGCKRDSVDRTKSSLDELMKRNKTVQDDIIKLHKSLLQAS